jgi:hypothetical protein
MVSADNTARERWLTLAGSTYLYYDYRQSFRASADIAQVVPLQYRLLTVNAVNIPWNAFLSLQNAKGKHTEPPVELSKMA